MEFRSKKLIAVTVILILSISLIVNVVDISVSINTFDDLETQDYETVFASLCFSVEDRVSLEDPLLDIFSSIELPEIGFRDKKLEISFFLEFLQGTITSRKIYHFDNYENLHLIHESIFFPDPILQEIKTGANVTFSASARLQSLTKVFQIRIPGAYAEWNLNEFTIWWDQSSLEENCATPKLN